MEEAAERYGRAGFRPYLAVLFYGFNLHDPTFNDPRFREAIVHAIDRKAIASVVYGGSVTRIDGLVPRGVPEFQADACGATCTYDPDKARSMLRALFPNGGIPQVPIDVEDDQTQQAVAKAIAANLAAVGITAPVRPHPVADYAQVVAQGHQGLFRLGWVGGHPRADAFLDPLFRSGTDTNVTGFALGVIDDLLRSATAEPDDAKRVAIYRDAERRIMALVPIVPVAQFETLSVTTSRVHGLVVDLLGTFDGAAVWLSG